MSEHRSFTFENLLSLLEGDDFWEDYLKQSLANSSTRLHLAIFIEPYLQYILAGLKTVESRFSSNRCAPYNTIDKGDVILLKRSGGPIIGICHVQEAWFYHLDNKSWELIRKEFTEALCAQDPNFWKNRKSASFATLIKIDNVRSLSPFPFPKKDRRGWVILKNISKQQKFEGL